MIAAELGNYAIVSLLSRNNADLQIQDDEGKGEQKYWSTEPNNAFFLLSLPIDLFDCINYACRELS